jgi:hypothetical protein
MGMIFQYGETRWIQSNGGPLLLLAQSLLRDWGGILRGTQGLDAEFRWRGEGCATDYDRACDVKDYVGVIRVGAGHGLVLGEEPFLTCWRPSADREGGILVRWVCADNESAVRKHFKGLDEVQFTSTPHILRVAEPDHYLFDSSEPGEDLGPEDALPVDLAPGVYGLANFWFKPDSSTELQLHRLRRIKP